MRTARQWIPTASPLSRTFHTASSPTTNPHHEASLGSIVSRNHLALHKKYKESSWHPASRYTSASIHPNLGQLDNKRWVLWFVRRIRDDRHTMQRMNFGFLVSQMESFVGQIETLRATNERLRGNSEVDGVHSSDQFLLQEGRGNAASARRVADISDVEVQNLFYLELSRQMPLLEEAMEGARLPHLVRLVTLFPRLSIAKVPSVRRSATAVHDHYPDVTPTCALGQKLRLAALIENTLAEIDERANALLEQYNTLHKRERVDFDNQMKQLHAAVEFFGPKWRDDVFQSIPADNDRNSRSSGGEGSEEESSRFPTLEKIFMVVEEQRCGEAAAATRAEISTSGGITQRLHK